MLPAEVLDRVLEAGMRSVVAEEAGRNGTTPPLARGRRADAVVYDGQKVWVVEAKRYGGGGPAHQRGAAGPVRPSSSGGPGAAPAVRSRRRRARAGR